MKLQLWKENEYHTQLSNFYHLKDFFNCFQSTYLKKLN
jgi:hypothetical protein